MCAVACLLTRLQDAGLTPDGSPNRNPAEERLADFGPDAMVSSRVFRSRGRSLMRPTSDRVRVQHGTVRTDCSLAADPLLPSYRCTGKLLGATRFCDCRNRLHEVHPANA